MDQQELHANKQTFRPHNTFEKICRLLDFEHGQKLRILDVGCGPGILDEHLRSLGHTVLGLDTYVPEDPSLFPGHVDFANPEHFLHTDINKPWPVPEHAFDLVICTDVPEHVYDPTQILAQSKIALKPEGQLIFGVPNHFDLRQRLRMLWGGGIVHWDNLKYGEKPWTYAHIRFFRLSDVLEMFALNKWYPQVIQLNFMAGGIVPVRLTPKFIRTALLRLWPGLFSGKIIILAGLRTQAQAKYIFLDKTPLGL